MYKKILVPLDGSELAEAALPHACALAKPADAELVLLQVLRFPVALYLEPDGVVMPELWKETEENARTYMEGVAARWRECGAKVTHHITDGPVADTIIDYAAAIQADLIVMSTHGRTGMSRWLIGSVADRVVHGASVPVLLIRPEPTITQASAAS